MISKHLKNIYDEPVQDSTYAKVQMSVQGRLMKMEDWFSKLDHFLKLSE
jgi:hypothetical protein